MFERISVPTPFQVGAVNAYRCGDTLVDPGPDSEEALSALQAGLDGAGQSLSDVERVLITHPHPDHFGLAKRCREHGATVVASAAAAPIVEDFPGRLDAEQAYFQDFFESCGMSPTTARTVTGLPDAFAEYAPSVAVDRRLDAGDTVTIGDTTADVVGVEGHAVGEIAIAYDEGDRREAIVGDTVLPTITPNPFLQPPPGPDADRPRVLPAYNESLSSLRARSIDRMLPGHGDAVTDPAGRIDDILAANEDRTEAVAAVVDDPTRPVTVMGELFGDLPVTEQFSGMSEAVGHLDVLEARGRVRPVEIDGALHYEPVE
ncbi:MBL fold metallo-hydrolase [Halapricum sp. CBA1109]|uniref:MBL fold metallo-hydrolase n=1 Tax=Halapricum sp. CBA1109 TaxID=2668068 RepID=UPI0013BAAF09|nr:MBL fold metallo-hydrolase [Halapricum sp. CBA1109]